jgi:hypothetical protein
MTGRRDGTEERPSSDLPVEPQLQEDGSALQHMLAVTLRTAVAGSPLHMMRPDRAMSKTIMESRISHQSAADLSAASDAAPIASTQASDADWHLT